MQIATIFISGWGILPDQWHQKHCDKTLLWHQVIDYLAQINHHVILIGWSLGAMVACDAAKLYPQKVKGLFLYAPTLQFIGGNFGIAKAPLRAMERKSRENHKQVITDYLASINAPLGLQDFSCTKEDTLKGLSYLANWNFHEKIKDLKMVVACSADNNDTVIPIAASKEFWQALPNRYKWFTTNKHHAVSCFMDEVMVECEKEFCEYIKNTCRAEL